MLGKIKRFLVSEEGPSTTEYAVMLALIIGLCLGGLQLFGSGAAGLWGNNSTQIGNSMSTGAGS